MYRPPSRPSDEFSFRKLTRRLGKKKNKKRFVLYIYTRVAKRVPILRFARVAADEISRYSKDANQI